MNQSNEENNSNDTASPESKTGTKWVKANKSTCGKKLSMIQTINMIAKMILPQSNYAIECHKGVLFAFGCLGYASVIQCHKQG